MQSALSSVWYFEGHLAAKNHAKTETDVLCMFLFSQLLLNHSNPCQHVNNDDGDNDIHTECSYISTVAVEYF